MREMWNASMTMRPVAGITEYSGKIGIKECLSPSRSLHFALSFTRSLVSHIVLLVCIGFVRLVFLNECQQREEKHVLLYVAFTNVTDRIAIYRNCRKRNLCCAFLFVIDDQLSRMVQIKRVKWRKNNNNKKMACLSCIVAACNYRYRQCCVWPNSWS